MRVLALCAVVIAGSTFATAVENIYGWSNLKPVVQKSWDAGYRWGRAMLDPGRQSGNSVPSAKLTINKKMGIVN